MFFHVPVHLGSPPLMSIWFKYGSQRKIRILYESSFLISDFSKVLLKYCSNSQAPNILSCLPALLAYYSFFIFIFSPKPNSAATNKSNNQLKLLQALCSFVCIQRYWLHKWGQKCKIVLKPWSTWSSCTPEKDRHSKIPGY